MFWQLYIVPSGSQQVPITESNTAKSVEPVGSIEHKSILIFKKFLRKLLPAEKFDTFMNKVKKAQSNLECTGVVRV